MDVQHQLGIDRHAGDERALEIGKKRMMTVVGLVGANLWIGQRVNIVADHTLGRNSARNLRKAWEKGNPLGTTSHHCTARRKHHQDVQTAELCQLLCRSRATMFDTGWGSIEIEVHVSIGGIKQALFRSSSTGWARRNNVALTRSQLAAQKWMAESGTSAYENDSSLTARCSTAPKFLLS